MYVHKIPFFKKLKYILEKRAKNIMLFIPFGHNIHNGIKPGKFVQFLFIHSIYLTLDFDDICMISF